MWSRKLNFIIISVILFLTVAVRPTFAVTLPNFGSCLNPQITPSQINTGSNHGVVGSDKPYAGVDTIYKLPDGNLLQCLCQDNGDGTQTIWFKVSSYSQEEILSLQSQGWIYVPTGTAWGLEDAPYLAKNSNYACKGTGGGSSSSNSDSSESSSPSVLGLATTGNTLVIYGFILAGFVSLFLGLLLKKISK